MNDDFVTDPVDDEIRARLRSSTIEGTDTEGALDAIRPRARRARRRRRVGLAATGSGALAILVLVVALADDPSRIGVETVTPAGPETTRAEVGPPTTESSTPTSSVPTTTSPTPSSSPSDSATPEPSDSSTPSASVEPPTSDPAPPTTTTPSSLRPAEVKTLDGVGGSITVDFDGATLTLTVVEPASSFVADVTHEEPDRVEVRFESDDHTTRIEVRVGDEGLDERVDESS